MNTNHNRIRVADLETNQQNKVLKTNQNGELEFSDINNLKTDGYNGLDYTAEGKVLDARQGKVLKDLIDNFEVPQLPKKTVSTHTPTGIPANGEEWILYTL